MGILQTLNPGDYHITVIAPETYTTFTPLLPCEHVWPHSDFFPLNFLKQRLLWAQSRYDP